MSQSWHPAINQVYEDALSGLPPVPCDHPDHLPGRAFHLRPTNDSRITTRASLPATGSRAASRASPATGLPSPGFLKTGSQPAAPSGGPRLLQELPSGPASPFSRRQEPASSGLRHAKPADHVPGQYALRGAQYGATRKDADQAQRFSLGSHAHRPRSRQAWATSIKNRQLQVDSNHRKRPCRPPPHPSAT
jgi:hypothetical protein